MAEITTGEIRLFPYGTVIPAGWLACEGQILQIQTNAALYALLGTKFGGNGTTTFGLPDLRGRTPVALWMYTPPDPNRIGAPTPLQMGNAGGTETVTLTLAQIPAHTHEFMVQPSNIPPAAITNSVPSSCIKQSSASAAAPQPPNIYAQPGTLVPVNPGFIGSTGGSGAHENRQPFLALRFCICTQGYFPARN